MDDASLDPNPYRIGFRPLGDRLLVRPDAPEMVSRGGIILPDSMRDKQKREVSIGTVLRMGPGMVCADGSMWPMPKCKPGDKIVFYKDGAVRDKLPDHIEGSTGEEVLLRDDFILGVLEEDADGALTALTAGEADWQKWHDDLRTTMERAHKIVGTRTSDPHK